MEALAEWSPVYKFERRRGFLAWDRRDLAQKAVIIHSTDAVPTVRH
jgi:hypothetical protein